MSLVWIGVKNVLQALEKGIACFDRNFLGELRK